MRIQGLFRGFGPFFGDSWPFLGIRSLFQGFAAFSWIHGLFTDSWPFCGFMAFSQIHRFMANKGSEGSKRATWRNFRYLIFLISMKNINIVLRNIAFPSTKRKTQIKISGSESFTRWLAPGSELGVNWELGAGSDGSKVELPAHSSSLPAHSSLLPSPLTPLEVAGTPKTY